MVVQGIQLYANALKKSRFQSQYTIRLIQKQDNDQIAHRIRIVMTEFRAVGAGHSYLRSYIVNSPNAPY